MNGRSPGSLGAAHPPGERGGPCDSSSPVHSGRTGAAHRSAHQIGRAQNAATLTMDDPVLAARSSALEELTP
jgi:hypothetical protein